MANYYRDQPQPSMDMHRYYDDGSTANLDIPMASRSAGGVMYNQAAAASSTDVVNRGYGTGPGYNESYAGVYGSRSNQWLESGQQSSKKSKWIVVGSVVALLILIAVGVTVGVVVTKNNNKSNGGSSSSSSSSSGGSTPKQTDPNDPSTFVKNPDLHQSFYGMAYTPKGSQLPACGNSLAEVIADIQLISQLTKRIRLYGADCNQSALVLEAVKQTKVDLTVYLGNYVIATDNGDAYKRQRDLLKDAIATYGVDHIGGVTVGNEFMLNYLNANSATDPNSDVGNTGAQILISNIQDTRTMLAGMSLSKTLPVGTSDAGSYFNTEVLQAVDYGMANVHPWFANVSAADAAGWTSNFFQETNVDAANALSNKPQMYIAETGWPTKSSDKGNESNGPGTADLAGLQTFLDTFVCQANSNGTGYFFFEFFDEPWKDAQFGGVEGWWGLFTSDRKLKNVKIPDCPSP